MTSEFEPTGCNKLMSISPNVMAWIGEKILELYGVPREELEAFKDEGFKVKQV